jgi:hypothetical protein
MKSIFTPLTFFDSCISRVTIFDLTNKLQDKQKFKHLLTLDELLGLFFSISMETFFWISFLNGRDFLMFGILART